MKENLKLIIVIVACIVIGYSVYYLANLDHKLVYVRGAISVQVLAHCVKPKPAYGYPRYIDYTFKHGQPQTCEDVHRILKEIGEE